MAIAYREHSIPGTHTIAHRTRDTHRGNPVRNVEVLATPDEIRQLGTDGYLVREKLLPWEEIERLRSALDETVARDTRLETQGGKSFGGVFIRHLMDKHPAFLEFVKFAPTLSIARAMLGPVVAIRGFTGRVCDPSDPNQETEWHFHQRVIPEPQPAWFSRPHTLDILLYLDDLDERNGPLCVVPGSHQWTERDLPRNNFDNIDGQVVLTFPAGSCVMAHGSLWHRAMPTQPDGTRRRLLLFGYGAAWNKPAIYGVKPEDGLTKAAIAEGDDETRELLGVAGFM